ncbi:MAG: type II toxin-antitoxin system MqsR family toxin [Candidatus Nitrotoga sp.]
MEKRKPNYLLTDVLAIVAARGVDAFTQTALHGAWELGLTSKDAVAVVLGLRQTNFYKSMTTHADHLIWQDVYHADLKSGSKAYIKLTLRENGIIVIQFKEK